MPQTFSLQAFPGSHYPPTLAITGTVAREQLGLRVKWQLQGDLTKLDIPPPSEPPQRRDGLWHHTCFELFIAPSGQQRYWEYNLSPSGHWNCYRFNAYRQQMATETTISALPCRRTSSSDDELQLALSLALPPLLRDQQSLDIGISAVIECRNGSHSYWALAHPNPQPDFHCQGSFSLILDTDH